MNGWQKVGAGLGALFNPEAGDEAYRARVAENLTLEQKMAAAGKDRLRMMAIERIANDPTIDPFERDLIVGELGNQFSGVQQGNLRQQEFGLREQARDMALEAGLGFNAPLAAIQGKPLQNVETQADGKVLIRNVYGQAPDVSMTDLGLGELFADQARGNASNASAAASNARANLYTEQATNPDRFRAPPRAGAVNPGVYTTKDAMDAIEYNRMANRPGSGMTPIPVPVPGTPKGGAASPTSIIPQPPKIGDVLDGYRFNGGDPADPASWEKV